ncbi:hypothetical protein B0H13DRAFT_1699371 [Mycena leptocephala]|nr:hypothetical protein B0H13DRAFT_1699371 [Mycena leptocephala]
MLNNGAVPECGKVIQDSDLAVAIPSAVWNGGAHCGAPVTVTFNGKPVQLTVEGECPICIASGIDITEAAYTALGASVRGPPTVNWQFD